MLIYLPQRGDYSVLLVDEQAKNINGKESRSTMRQLNIHTTQKGDLVVFKHPANGTLGDRSTAEKYLVLGQSYCVKKVEIHSWHTKVYIEGFNFPFNSVMFDNV